MEDALPCNGQAELGEAVDDAAGTTEAIFTKAGEFGLKGGVFDVDVITEHVDIDAVVVGAEFDAGDDDRPALRGLLRFGDAGGGVVVGDGDGVKGVLAGKLNQFRWPKLTIGSGGMQMQIEPQNKAPSGATPVAAQNYLLLWHAWFDSETNGSSFLTINIDFREIGRKDDVNLITAEIAARDCKRFHSLIHGTRTNSLHFSITVLADDSGDGTRDCG